MIKVKCRGDFSNTEGFFKRVLRRDYLQILEKYGKRGVNILQNATPSKTGKVASSWGYVIEEKKGVTRLAFTNGAENKGVNVVLMIMYGHAMPNGAYIEGEDFVTPAIMPMFREMVNDLWEEVKS